MTLAVMVPSQPVAMQPILNLNGLLSSLQYAYHRV